MVPKVRRYLVLACDLFNLHFCFLNPRKKNHHFYIWRYDWILVWVNVNLSCFGEIILGDGTVWVKERLVIYKPVSHGHDFGFRRVPRRAHVSCENRSTRRVTWLLMRLTFFYAFIVSLFRGISWRRISRINIFIVFPTFSFVCDRREQRRRVYGRTWHRIGFPGEGPRLGNAARVQPQHPGVGRVVRQRRPGNHPYLVTSCVKNSIIIIDL